MPAELDRTPRFEPPLVYPSPGSPGEWVVESPVLDDSPSTLFNGPNAMNMALLYAYETFGNARFFPF